MPKRTKYPKLRSHSWRTAGGEVRTAYYYDRRGTGDPDIPLGTDYAQAVKRWAEIHLDAPRKAGTLAEAFDAWERDTLPAYTSATTRRDYALCLTQLRPVFQAARWADVSFPILKAYLRKRTAKTRANRELAVLSIIWNWARGEGLTEQPWPAAGMERSRWKNTEQARQVEVSDELFAAVYAHADQVLRDCMDIASATGLRLTDCRTVGLPADGILRVQASKTGKRLRIDVSEHRALLALIERRKGYRGTHTLLLSTPTGRQVSQLMLRDRWEAARAAAAEANPKLATDIRALYLRDMRKRAANAAPTDQAAAELLQHDDPRLTVKHYRTKVRTVKAVG